MSYFFKVGLLRAEKGFFTDLTNGKFKAFS